MISSTLMTITKEEIMLIDFCFKISVNKNHEGLFLPRVHDPKDQPIVIDIYRKIRPAFDSNKELETDFSTEEKALILNLINRPLDVDFLEASSSLKDKLK